MKNMSAEDWLNLSREKFDRLFKGTPVERRKFEPFMNTVRIVAKPNS
jgi:epoxyqueuosine reductase QueG